MTVSLLQKITTSSSSLTYLEEESALKLLLVYAKEDNLGFDGLPILAGDSERGGCPRLLALTNRICLFGEPLDSSLCDYSCVSSSSSLSSPYSYSLSSSSGFSP